MNPTRVKFKIKCIGCKLLVIIMEYRAMLTDFRGRKTFKCPNCNESLLVNIQDLKVIERRILNTYHNHTITTK